MSAQCTEAQFRRDVTNHTMTVFRDDGVYRHISFTQGGSSVYRFDLHTWPGSLCYTGDMGTYVFRRIDDMFEFFRCDRAHRRNPELLAINPGYWGEKLLSVDGGLHGGKAMEFSEEKFRRVINEYRVSWMREAKESGSLDKSERRELWEAVDEEVIRQLEEGGDRALYAAYDFQHDPRSNSKRPYGWHFQDLFENNFTEYTHSFLWCCYALAWGVEVYDKAKQAAEAAVPA